MHAHAVAAGLKLKEIICPASAGVLSAWGMLVAPTAFEFARSLVGVLSDEVVGNVDALFAEMEAEGLRMLVEAGVGESEVHFERSIDARYVGQYRELTVPLPSSLSTKGVEAIRKLFFDHYHQTYGHAHRDVDVQLVTCRLVASSTPRGLSNRSVDRSGPTGDAKKGERAIYFDSVRSYVPTSVYDRYLLGQGTTILGPAVLEERESTAVVPPGARACIDQELNLVIELDAEKV
jgi:N-methylhydantoinase A